MLVRTGLRRGRQRVVRETSWAALSMEQRRMAGEGIELLFDKLSGPMGISLDLPESWLYWTDRGEYVFFLQIHADTQQHTSS